MSAALARDLEEELTCVVCHDRLQDPRVLPCLHTFCRACIADVQAHPLGQRSPAAASSSSANEGHGESASAGFFPCPTCRHACDAATAASQLPRNFVAANLLDVLRVHAGPGGDGATEGNVVPDGTTDETLVCGLCENLEDGADDAGSDGAGSDGAEPAEPAAARCLTCAVFLCEDHRRVHGKARSTRGHEVCTVEAFRERCQRDPAGLAAESARRAAPRRCADHSGETLRLFCATCDEAICRDCTIVDHKDHSYEFLDKVYEAQRAVVEAAVSGAAGCAERLRGAAAAVTEAEAAARANADAARAEAAALAASLIEQVRAWEAGLVDEIAGVCADKVKGLVLQREELTAMAASVDDGVAFARAVLDAGGAVDVLQQKKLVTARLENLRAAVEARPLGPCCTPGLQLSVPGDAPKHWSDTLASVTVSGCELHLPSCTLEVVPANAPFAFAAPAPGPSLSAQQPESATSSIFRMPSEEVSGGRASAISPQVPRLAPGGSATLRLILRDAAGRLIPETAVSEHGLFTRIGDDASVATPVARTFGRSGNELRFSVSVPEDIVGVVPVRLQLGETWSAATSTAPAQLIVVPPGLVSGKTIKIENQETAKQCATVISSNGTQLAVAGRQGIVVVDNTTNDDNTTLPLSRFGIGAVVGMCLFPRGAIAVWDTYHVAVLHEPESGGQAIRSDPLTIDGRHAAVAGVCPTADGSKIAILAKGSSGYVLRLVSNRNMCAMGADTEFPGTSQWQHVALVDANTIVGVTADGRSVAWMKRGIAGPIRSWKPDSNHSQMLSMTASQGVVFCTRHDQNSNIKLTLLSHHTDKPELCSMAVGPNNARFMHPCQFALTSHGIVALSARNQMLMRIR
jgi:hypothetical protein